MNGRVFGRCIAWVLPLWVVGLLAGCRTQDTPPAQPTGATQAAVVGDAHDPPAAAKLSAAAVGTTELESAAVRQLAAKAVSGTAETRYAIVVSVDGLAPRFLEQLLQQGRAPTFAALQTLGAWTHNARTDKTYTITLPNHTSMVTGLPVSPAAGFEPHRAHRYTDNGEPEPRATLHTLRDEAHPYTPSMFDVAHDNGLSTAMFVSKTKFAIYSQSYNDAGGPDLVGEDNGRKKIDTVVIDRDVTALVAKLIAKLESDPPNLTFLHFGTPDAMGHGVGWGSLPYLAALQQVDSLLGRILSTLQKGPLANKGALIITADHGGNGNHHHDVNDIRNFQIPFYVMAKGVAPGDAYGVFKARFAPGDENPEYDDPRQPLRNGDSGNVALELLGLEPIPDSIIHSAGLVLK